MDRIEKKLEFLEKYAELCRKYEMFIKWGSQGSVLEEFGERYGYDPKKEFEADVEVIEILVREGRM